MRSPSSWTLCLLLLDQPFTPNSLHSQIPPARIISSLRVRQSLRWEHLYCEPEGFDLLAETDTTFTPPSPYYFSLRRLAVHLNENITLEEFQQSFAEFREIALVKPVADKIWHTIFDACLRRRLESLAVEMFDLMVSKYVPCSSHQLTSLLLLVQEKGSYEEALAFLDKAVAVGMEPTVHNFSPLLKACGSAKKARQILARMQVSRVEPNVISFSAAIKSCEQMGDWRSSIELLELMRAYGVAPNEITYCCIISAGIAYTPPVPSVTYTP